jgi:DedD protein
MAELGTGRVKSSLLDDLDETRDTEITLGTGKLLGIFFALTILCAVFFTMGYLLGKSSVAGGRTEIVGTVPSGGSAAGKPSAVNKAPETPPPAPSADASSQQATASASTASTSAPSAQVNPTPTVSDIKSNVNGTYTVQVAAVSKQEDADILATALRKKQYPVFIASATGDALFHVQVGPFSTQQDADTMRNRLSADGYNAIVKH